MAVEFGGIFDGAGANHIRIKQLFRDAQRIHGDPDYNDYVVDLAFCTYPPNRRPEWIDWRGVKAGAVGRTQKRFIVWIEVPPDLADSNADREWLMNVLTQSAALVREHVPRKSKAYPVDRLAKEIVAIRDGLATD